MCQWHVSLCQTLLAAYNVVLLVFGLLLGALGIHEARTQEHATLVHKLATHLIIVGAGFMLFVSILGFISICRLHRGLLSWYGLLLAFVLILELASGTLCYYAYGFVKAELRNQFRSLFLDEYGKNSATTHRINLLQRKLKCCGMDGFEDWEHSQWVRDHPSKTYINVVPPSCCKTWDAFCGRWDIPNNIYYDGCTMKMAKSIVHNLVYIATIGAVVCVSQIVGVLITYILYMKLKNYERASYVACSLNRRHYHNFEYG